MNLNDFATINFTQIGANILNADNERFNEIFQRELKTDYKEGDVYENILWCILILFVDCYEDPLKSPFTNLEKLRQNLEGFNKWLKK
ncbi:hypothetical protein [Dysgonomonas sp. GY617]|uniref:hypothetical protein n=1 Tax=Dysgonomonas sp. GY617 TaxID=2780420 RepID=UPI0018841283|nr:hypothetical protein [Dysgonomonas sp. GY617]MBF0576049.1 hypothetical protein [Dysgonomonas sp. GY617]